LERRKIILEGRDKAIASLKTGEKALGKTPEWITSYDAFYGNDKVLLDYYEQRGINVPYHRIN
jgi:hypothetical protein